MRSIARHHRVTIFSLGAAIVLACSALLSSCACLGGSSPPPGVYMLEYSSPAFAGRQPSLDGIRVARFAPAEAFAVTTMIVRTAPNKRDLYPSAWWTVHPGFLVTDLLLRDMRRSGLFRSVFSYRDDADVRYLLGGTVEEFLEDDGENGPAALIVVSATLLDQTARKSASKGVVFQRTYREREPLAVKAPQALAVAMSAAMERLSRSIQSDLSDAMQNRPEEK